MALSGTFYSGTIQSSYRVRVAWSGSQSVSGNYTDITMNVYWESISSYGTVNSSDSKSGNSKIDGTQENFSFNASLSGNQSKLVNTQTKRVYHNADGTKSIALSAYLGIAVTLSGTYYSGVSASDTVTLNAIPRNSTLTSSPTWTNGHNLPITISRSDSSFTHDVGVYVDGVQYRRLEKIGSSATITWTEAELTDMFTRANGNELNTQINVITYDGDGNQIGSYIPYTGKLLVPSPSYVNDIPAFTLGDSVSFSMTRSQAFYTANIGVYYDDPSGNPVYLESVTGVGATGVWTPSQTALQAIYEAYPTTDMVPIRFRARTYYNGIMVSNTAKDTVATGIIATGKPTFSRSSVRHADTNSTTASLTGNNQIMVGGKSQLTVYIDQNPVAQNGSTMKQLIIQADGKSKTIDMTGGKTAVGTHLIGTVSNSQYQSVVVRAIDSRGLETQVSYDLTVLPYSVPTANIFGARRNKFDALTDIAVNGTFSELKIGTTPKNIITSVQYRFKESTVSTYGAWKNMSFTPNGGSFVTTTATETLDNTKAYNLQVQVTDKAGSSTMANYTVGAGSPILFVDADKNSVGVGKFPTGFGTLETQGDVDAGGKMKVGSTTKGSFRFDGTKLYLEDASGNGINFKPTTSYTEIDAIGNRVDFMCDVWMWDGNLNMYQHDILDVRTLTARTLASPTHKFDNGANWLSVRSEAAPSSPDMFLIQNKTAVVNMSTAGINVYTDIQFPIPFDEPPLWILATGTGSNSSSYYPAIYNPSAQGCRVYSTHYQGSAIASATAVSFNVVACGIKR